MATKKELIKKAKALGLETDGTKAQIEERIRQLAFDEDEYEDDPTLEPEPVKEEPKPEPKPKKAPVREAIPSKLATDLVTRKALKSTVKFIGRWYTLRAGKDLTAPKAVIDSLASAGLVEKK